MISVHRKEQGQLPGQELMVFTKPVSFPSEGAGVRKDSIV